MCYEWKFFNSLDVLHLYLHAPSVVVVLFPQLMLSLLGFKSTETGRVSEEELRLIVTGAKLSGGIESQEGSMIEGVLDLQVSVIEGVIGVWCGPNGNDFFVRARSLRVSRICDLLVQRI